MASPRISWLEAANLVSFVGEDASVEEILVFVDHERYLWRQTPYLIRSEEHTSELQSLMRISYAVFCLKKKKKNTQIIYVQVSSKEKNIPDINIRKSYTQ